MPWELRYFCDDQPDIDWNNILFGAVGVQLGSDIPETRTDVYLNLNREDVGLKFRHGIGNGAGQLECKKRSKTRNGLEKWSKTTFSSVRLDVQAIIRAMRGYSKVSSEELQKLDFDRDSISCDKVRHNIFVRSLSNSPNAAIKAIKGSIGYMEVTRITLKESSSGKSLGTFITYAFERGDSDAMRGVADELLSVLQFTSVQCMGYPEFIMQCLAK
jgi:hypothetical protein